MDNISPDPAIPDDLTNAADELGQNLADAPDAIGGMVDGLTQQVEEGITGAEQKLDDFMGGLNNLLGKF